MSTDLVAQNTKPGTEITTDRDEKTQQTTRNKTLLYSETQHQKTIGFCSIIIKTHFADDCFSVPVVAPPDIKQTDDTRLEFLFRSAEQSSAVLGPSIWNDLPSHLA